MKKQECDVLIIGAGGAGLRAAISVAEAGMQVTLVTKTLLGKAHTAMAEGGIAASLGSVDPQDDWQQHFFDTMEEGQFLSHPEKAEIFAKEAPERVMELEEWGALFDRTPEGKIMQRPFGAHTYRRVCHVSDRTGLEILRTLQDKAIHYKNISMLEEVYITKLFVDNGKVIGCFAIDMKKGTYLLITLKAIIMACGGLGKMYKITSNSGETTGNGFALALDSGAELKDMEMIQFHPTGMVYPESVKGMLVTEAIRGEGGVLTNKNGERFMKRYDPERMELSARDVVARAIYYEIQAGRGTDKNAVYLDISFKGKNFIKKKLRGMYNQFLEFAHLDISKEKMEVAPTCHYMMGGVNVEPHGCETNVKGLYAVGEVAAGLHGGNRLGGNSLSDILVFGKRAGEHAASYAKKAGRSDVKRDDVEKEIHRLENLRSNKKSKIKASQVRDELRKLMWKHVSIMRNEKGLKTAKSEIKKLKQKMNEVRASDVTKYNLEWVQILDIIGMLNVAEVIIESAMLRKESRGAHTRDDFKKKDDKNWKKNIIFSKKGGRLRQLIKPVPELKPEIKKIIGEKMRG